MSTELPKGRDKRPVPRWEIALVATLCCAAVAQMLWGWLRPLLD